MISETGLKCVVSGSFEKHKPEIDRTIEEFQDLGVTVLAPSTGWLLKPHYHILTPKTHLFRPLSSEKEMSVRQVEDSFLNYLSLSDFQYIENPNGYVGNSAAFEFGFALAHLIPVFCRFSISTIQDDDTIWIENIARILVFTPQETVKMIQEIKGR